MQRRADFMADVGEETAFGFRGGVGCLHGLLELGVEALEILGLGAFSSSAASRLFCSQPAPELERNSNDQQQDGQDDFNAEQAGPERARGSVERRLAAEPAVVDEFPLGRLDLVQGFGKDAAVGPVQRTPMDRPLWAGWSRSPEAADACCLPAWAGRWPCVDQRVGMPGHDPEQPAGIADRSRMMSG